MREVMREAGHEGAGEVMRGGRSRGEGGHEGGREGGRQRLLATSTHSPKPPASSEHHGPQRRNTTNHDQPRNARPATRLDLVCHRHAAAATAMPPLPHSRGASRPRAPKG